MKVRNSIWAILLSLPVALFVFNANATEEKAATADVVKAVNVDADASNPLALDEGSTDDWRWGGGWGRGGWGRWGGGWGRGWGGGWGRGWGGYWGGGWGGYWGGYGYPYYDYSYVWPYYSYGVY